MAGAGYKLFNTGDVLTAAQVNTYLQEQVVMVFANAAARTTALSGVLAEGMVSYLKDTDALEIYSGSAWVGYGSGDITGVTAGTGISGGGTSGSVTITNSMATEITAAGDIIVGTGSGTFDNLPIGTTGQVLTADTTVSPYKVKWATTSSSSGLTLIKTATFSNVADTGTTFDDVFTSTYENYYISFNEVYGAVASGLGDLHFQFRYAGPTTQTTGYNYRNTYVSGISPAATTLLGVNGDSKFMMCDSMGNSAGYGTNGWMDINKLKASSRPFVNYRLFSEAEQAIFGGAYESTARTYTGFILSASSLNIWGTVSVYGLAK